MRRHYNANECFAAAVLPQRPVQLASPPDDWPRHVVVLRRDGSRQSYPTLSMRIRTLAPDELLYPVYEQMVAGCDSVALFSAAHQFFADGGMKALRDRSFGDGSAPCSTPAIGREVDLWAHLGFAFVSNPAAMVEICHVIGIPAPVMILPRKGKRPPASAFAEQQAVAVYILYLLILAWRRRDDALWSGRAGELRDWLSGEEPERWYLHHYTHWLGKELASRT